METPRTLFHATLTRNVESIMASGLRPPKRGEGNFEGQGFDTQGITFMADNERDARFFGSAAAMEANDPTLDFSILLVDSLKARALDIPMIDAPGLDPDAYEGSQYICIETVPPSCLMKFKRVYRDLENGGIKTETFREGAY